MHLQRILLDNHAGPDSGEERVFGHNLARMVQKHDKKIERAGG